MRNPRDVEPTELDLRNMGDTKLKDFVKRKLGRQTSTFMSLVHIDRQFNCPGRCVYAVSVIDQPALVKMGRSADWAKRRLEYANWNLRNGDGIAEASVFYIGTPYISVSRLEAHLLRTTPFKLGARSEWFDVGWKECCAFIEMTLRSNRIPYTTSQELSSNPKGHENVCEVVGS